MVVEREPVLATVTPNAGGDLDLAEPATAIGDADDAGVRRPCRRPPRASVRPRPGHSTTNSSPPQPGDDVDRRRAPAVARPRHAGARRPRRRARSSSFTTLNRSRSMNSSADLVRRGRTDDVHRVPRADRAAAPGWAVPVSASWVARWARSASCALPVGEVAAHRRDGSTSHAVGVELPGRRLCQIEITCPSAAYMSSWPIQRSPLSSTGRMCSKKRVTLSSV